MARVYLIRHADVENPRRLLYGHLDGFGLSGQGKRQAAALGVRLRDDPPRRILYSPLQRARQTAEIIAANLGSPVELQPESALREAEFSRYLQGIPYWQIPMRRPLWFVHKVRRGLLPQDESVTEMGKRILDVARGLGRAHPGDVSACVSHADPLQAAWILLDGRRHTEHEMYAKQVGRAGMLRLDLDGDRPVAWEYIAPQKLQAAEAPPEAAAGAA